MKYTQGNQGGNARWELAVLKLLDEIASLTTAVGGGWTLDGDAGTPQAVQPGNTVTFSGGTGMQTQVGATDTLTVNLEHLGIEDLTNPGVNSFMGWSVVSGAANWYQVVGSHLLDATSSEFRIYDFIIFDFTNETETLDSVGVSTGVRGFHIPVKFQTTRIGISLRTAPTTSSITVDINDDGTTMVGGGISLNAGSVYTLNAHSNAIASGSDITVDITSTDTGRTAAGGKIILLGYQID